MTYLSNKESSTIELFETIETDGVTEIVPSCSAVLISQNLLLSVAHNVGYFSHAKFVDQDSKPIFIEIKNYKTLTPELDEHFDLCLIKLPTMAPLMNKYNLGEVENIKMDTEGWVNPCFFVNQSFVFRFNARDPQLPKYQREFFVFNLLKKSDIPVPQIIYLDDSKEHSGFDVLITEMLPGANIESDWKNLSIDQRVKVSEEAGKNLFKLNQYSFDFFGELSSSGPLPRTKTWPDYLKKKLSFHLNEAMNLKIISKSVEANI